jgi:hypothetical protein
MDRSDFEHAIRGAKTPEDRVAWFGALLTRESGTLVEVVGGSAIEIYLSSLAYVSDDIDVVGKRDAIELVLARWGFIERTGRSQRRYWSHKAVGFVDLVGTADRSGLPPRRLSTPFGPVTLSAPEPLIIRRLVRSDREKSPELFRQAVLLARKGGLDWDYLASEARYEKVEAGLKRLRSELAE